MRSYNLNQTYQVELDGSGNGALVTAPSFYDEKWNVTSTGVLAASSTNPNANIPQIQVYVAGRFVDGSYNGSNNQSDTQYSAMSGEPITVTFLGGQPHDTITVTFLGTRTLP